MGRTEREERKSALRAWYKKRRRCVQQRLRSVGGPGSAAGVAILTKQESRHAKKTEECNGQRGKSY